jgi:hypothetical protein
VLLREPTLTAAMHRHLYERVPLTPADARAFADEMASR